MLEDQLDLFLQAYDAPTFSAAAALVPMTPQGFTKAIKKLEHDLGVPLFEFDERGARRPTAYADELYRYAKRARAERTALDDTFKRIKREERTNLKVACALGIPGLFGAEVIQGFSDIDDRAVVTFSELPDSLCDSLVIDGVFDVGITLHPAKSELETTPLLESPVLIWVNVGDPLSGKERLTLQDIAGRRIAMPGKEFRCYQNLMDACERAGVESPEVVEYSEIFWIYYYVLSGRGMGFCLPHLAKLEIFEDESKVVAVPFEGLRWQVCFSWPKSHELSQLEKDYFAYLLKRAERKMGRR